MADGQKFDRGFGCDVKSLAAAAIALTHEPNAA
jgi:hypothetical protein